MTSYVPFCTNPLFWNAWTENICSKIPLFILPSLQTFSRNNPAHTMTPRRAAAIVDFTLQQAFKIYTAAIAAAILRDWTSPFSRVIRSKTLEKLKENGQKWAKSDDESVDCCAAYVPTIPQCTTAKYYISRVHNLTVTGLGIRRDRHLLLLCLECLQSPPPEAFLCCIFVRGLQHFLHDSCCVNPAFLPF